MKKIIISAICLAAAFVSFAADEEHKAIALRKYEMSGSKGSESFHETFVVPMRTLVEANNGGAYDFAEYNNTLHGTPWGVKIYVNSSYPNFLLKDYFAGPGGGAWNYHECKSLYRETVSWMGWGDWEESGLASEPAEFSISSAANNSLVYNVNMDGHSLDGGVFSYNYGWTYPTFTWTEKGSGTTPMEVRSCVCDKKYSVENGVQLEATLYGTWVICESSAPMSFPSLLYNDNKGDGNSLIFATDLVSGDYASNQHPLLTQEKVVFSPTNFMLMTEWKFNQSAYGSPQAYINDKCVCGGHSTTHIIDYNMGTTEDWSYDPATKHYTVHFTMSIRIQGSYSGGACEFRCWSGGSTFDQSSFKASVSGNQSTVARFKLEATKYRLISLTAE